MTQISKTAINLFLSLVFLVSCSTPSAVISRNEKTQTYLQSFEVIRDLDLEITETSGLETYNGRLITHNDSDAGPIIYILDTLGNIQSNTPFNNMTNVDWEDIARSDTDLFLADIGNNHGNRLDLKIYSIPLTAIENKDVIPTVLDLSYQSQTDFNYKNQNHSFDGEATVFAQDRLLLFSKDWVNFHTNVYEVQTKPSKQTLAPIQDIDINGLVTGATFNGNDQIVLCGYNSNLQPFVAVLKTDDKKPLQLLERIELPLTNGAQIEAITYYSTSNNNDVYYLTSEAVSIQLGDDEAQTKGQLYKMTLKSK